MSSKKPSLPSQVVIGHRKIKVVLDPKMEEHGKYDSDGGCINLDPNKIDPKASLVHEMIHAVLDVSGVSQMIKDEDLEEAICVAMEMLTPNIEFKVGKR